MCQIIKLSITIIYRWTIDLFKIGYRKILQTDDLYTPLKTDRSNVLGDRLEKFVSTFNSIF